MRWRAASAGVAVLSLHMSGMAEQQCFGHQTQWGRGGGEGAVIGLRRTAPFVTPLEVGIHSIGHISGKHEVPSVDLAINILLLPPPPPPPPPPPLLYLPESCHWCWFYSLVAMLGFWQIIWRVFQIKVSLLYHNYHSTTRISREMALLSVYFGAHLFGVSTVALVAAFLTRDIAEIDRKTFDYFLISECFSFRFTPKNSGKRSSWQL